jgi:membrane-associated protease RseP (regulator of RpoE activity)
VSTPPLPPPGDPDRPDADRVSTPSPYRWSDDYNAWVSGPLTRSDTESLASPRVGSAPWVHLLLLVLTFASMTLAGAGMYRGYISALGLMPLPRGTTTASLFVGGLWFSVPALLILGSHEMGHYVACRYYRIPASLPYFVPLPFVSIVGTIGAVIRMALPRTRQALFDVGIAGPIAGFLVLVPFAILGVSQSYVVRLPRVVAFPGGLNLGDPLLLTLLQDAFFGKLPPRALFVMHPAGFAAWFGLIATSLNLFPAGQLDGGHIVHALVGRWSRYVTIASIAILLAMAVFVSRSWLVWTGLLLVMTYMFGLDHPPVAEHEPLGRVRLALAVFAVVMFILCFTPVPISPAEFLGGR